MPDINRIKALIFDLDGVLWRGQNPLPGVADIFRFLRQQSLPFVLATNNSTALPEKIQERMREMSVTVSLSEIVTSAQTTAIYLQQRFPAKTIIYSLGEIGLRTAILNAGFLLTDTANGAKAVVVGMDRTLTWKKLTEAALAIQAGAAFISTNADTSFPLERGLAPGAGANLAALQATTGVAPINIGKPESYMFLQALKQLMVRAEEILVLGDRLETDILGAQRCNMATGLVLTGVTNREMLNHSQWHPDLVFDDLPHVLRALSGSES